MRSGKHAPLLGLASGLILFILLSSANPAHAQTSGLATVTVTEQLQPLYDVYGGNSNQIIVDVSGNSTSLNSGSSFTIVTFFKPSLNSQVSQVGAIESGAPVGQSDGIYTTNFTLIAGATSFSVSLIGSEGGASFLWRYLAGAPFVTVTG